MNILFWSLTAVGLVLAVCVGYQILMMVASLPALWWGKAAALPATPQSRVVVVIPAHNEQAIIGQTVSSILASDYPAAQLEVVVIADNCTDDTAGIARAAGATCHERHDLTRVGKPHALNWILTRLDLERYDALVIIDGDTVIDRRFVRVMDGHLSRGERAIQGFYGVMNPDENWLTRLAGLPASLKFRLHFPGKRALGLSCPLAGNGMCFHIDVIKRFGWEAYSLTENWEYYIILTLNGLVVTDAPAAVIYAQVTRSLKTGETQRVRWMKGQLETAAKYGQALVWQGLTEPSVVKLDALFEITRPSHATLLFWGLAYGAMCWGAWWVGTAGGGVLLAGAATLLLAQAVYFISGIAVERPPLRTWLAFLMVPWYLAWKAAITLRGLLNIRDKRWVKTARHSID